MCNKLLEAKCCFNFIYLVWLVGDMITNDQYSSAKLSAKLTRRTFGTIVFVSTVLMQIYTSLTIVQMGKNTLFFIPLNSLRETMVFGHYIAEICGQFIKLSFLFHFFILSPDLNCSHRLWNSTFIGL